ncbi:hypothetical protein [Blautia wexlerae]|nr:hypothetical protein [Blautia wexlerae]
MNTLEWAKNEIAIASKRERGKNQRMNGIMVVRVMIAHSRLLKVF